VSEDSRPARVLVVAAHPDDEVLGMGGTVAVHALLRGDAVRILCVTDGSSTQYAGDAVKREQKNAEATRAAAVLGVEDFVHLDLPDMRLDTLAHADVNRVVEEHVRDLQPEIVYTVHPDVNRDHQALFDSVAVAVRPLPGQVVRRLLTYAPTSSTEWTPAGKNWFVPNWFVDISGTLERKLEAFACYETEARPYPHPRSSRAITAHAEFFGATSGCEYAEPFVLVRSVETSMLDRKLTGNRGTAG
jgi:N-acetylglucosamine malate deacetylase 1